MIRSITKCAICVAKENGVLNPEEHILHRYNIGTGINGLPTPIEDDGLETGILMLYPEDVLEETGVLPQTGGVFGTVRAMFRAFGFARTKEETVAEEPMSRSIAKGKRGKGLYGDE